MDHVHSHRTAGSLRVLSGELIAIGLTSQLTGLPSIHGELSRFALQDRQQRLCLLARFCDTKPKIQLAMKQAQTCLLASQEPQRVITCGVTLRKISDCRVNAVNSEQFL
jgi:hypothetical protein